MTRRSTASRLALALGLLAVAVLPADGDGPCEACPAKACVPRQEVKKSRKPVYAARAVEYCLPRCSLRSLLFGDCDAGCAACEPPRVKRVLVKRFVAVEKCETRCVLETASVPCAPVAGRPGAVDAAPSPPPRLPGALGSDR